MKEFFVVMYDHERPVPDKSFSMELNDRVFYELIMIDILI